MNYKQLFQRIRNLPLFLRFDTHIEFLQRKIGSYLPLSANFEAKRGQNGSKKPKNYFL